MTSKISVAYGGIVSHCAGGGAGVGDSVIVDPFLCAIGDATDIGAVVGVAGDVDDVVGGQYVVGVSVAVGHKVDVPGAPVCAKHPLEQALHGVGGAIEPLGVRLHAHDAGHRACVFDVLGEVGVPQRPVLLQDGHAVGVGRSLDGLERASDGYCRPVGCDGDGPNLGLVIDPGGEAGHLLGLQVKSRGA